jgi:post-segregation antitoxin (ccd killing protein)
MIMATVTPPRFTKQVLVMLEPTVSGEIFAAAEAAGLGASAMCRDLIAAGLRAKRKEWERNGTAPTPEAIERLCAEHREQGERQTTRRRGNDVERRKVNG